MMSPFTAQFSADLASLWANADENTTVYETADLIESLWGNCEITGFSPAIPTNLVQPVPQATYAALAPLAATPGPSSTAAAAASAIEAACLALCASTVFAVTPPASIAAPPAPLPGGPATPGLLTSALTGIFISGAADGATSPTAPSVAAEIVKFLSGWVESVVIPPASAAPIPII
jgi:hypothetical protein